MDANGNQRKRTGRMAKNANNTNNESPSPTHETIEPLEVSAVAISPTLEEAETPTNAPVSECRRSSRKKIIKFDVRDLLNKNRKTHKIQIEARIDSNAPTTSKASTAGGAGESANSKASSSAKEDLLSKQKTFLEKSAIFRRYSISQEHKPPPPPLPIPPLLGKANDNKDSVLTGSSTNRRLSRTQEFFSNVMIKPKQTTSLIVAQIESNTPSTTHTAKRRSLNKSVEQERKVSMSSDQEPLATNAQQKKRGRPAKFKTPEAVSSNVDEDAKETKKITPEKAKNWKEYKACLAQQTDGTEKETKEQDEKSKQDISFTTFEETSQSDISRSDDDGNFSGFHTSKDDTSCDSPVLEKLALPKQMDEKETADVVKEQKLEIISKDIIEPEVKVIQTEITDSKQKTSSSKIEENTSEQKQTQEIAITKPLSEIKKQQKELETVTKLEKKTKKTVIKTDNEETEEKSKDFELTQLNKKSDETPKEEIKKLLQNQEIEIEETIPAKEDIDLDETKEDKSVPETSPAVIEVPVTDNKTAKQPIRSKRRLIKKEDNKNIITTEQIENKTEDSMLETNKILEDDPGTSETPSKSVILETPKKSTRKSKTPDIVKATKLIDECTPETKLTTSDILLLTSQLTSSHPPTPSDETTKSSSRTSSSSESENASTYSSDPASTSSSSSSSSSRSYKSGDKLRVSLKRISLPKSPSTSSQTSTSEELNSGLNTEIVKKKPPIAKRSKRLQRKLLDETENIDDCFQNIEDKHKLEETLQSENIIAQSLQIESNSEAFEHSETSEHVITESLEKDNSVESVSTEVANSDSKSDKEAQLKDTSTVVKRKSLRNRKEIKSDDKDQNVQEIPTEKESESKELETSLKENKEEKLQESNIDLEILKSSESDKSEEIEDITKKLIKQRPQRKLKKQISSEEKKFTIEEKSEISDMIEEKSSEIQTEDAEQSIPEVSSKDTNKSSAKITDQQEKLTKVTTRKKTKKEVEKTDVEENVEATDQQEKSSKTSARSKANKEDITLEEAATLQENLETIEVVEKEVTKTSEKIADNQEKCIKSTSTRSKTNKDGSGSEETTSLEFTETKEVPKKVLKTKASQKINMEIAEDSPVRTKSPTTGKLDKTPKTKFKSNAEESIIPEDNVPETASKEIQAKATKGTRNANKSCEDIMTTSKETDDNKLEKIGKITRSKTNKEETSKQESKSSEDNVIASEISENLKENKSDAIENLLEISQELVDKSAVVANETDIEKPKETTKVTVTRSKAIKESTSKEEKDILIKEKSIQTGKEIVSKEIANKTELQEDNADTKIQTPTQNTKTCEDHDDEARTTTPEAKSSNISDDNKKVEVSKRSTTRSKTNKDESQNITPLRSKSKKTIEMEISLASAEPEEDMHAKTSEASETVETVLKEKPTSPKRSAKKINIPTEIPGSTQEENFEGKRKPSSPKRSDRKMDIAEEVSQTSQCKNLEDIPQANLSKGKASSAQQDTTEISTKSVITEAASTEIINEIAIESTGTSAELKLISKTQEILKDSGDQETPSSTKRKSLRNQKDKETTEDSLTLYTQTTAYIDNPQQLEETSTNTSQIEVEQLKEIIPDEAIPKPIKRRSRKSRFKNLHTPDVESETDSNNGNNTPIAELLQQKSEKPAEKEETKIIQSQPQEAAEADTNITETAKPNEEEPAKANLSTSQIQNVSIETNTLLDILRRVQSNTEAALKANKPSADIQNPETEQIVETSNQACLEEPTTSTSQDLLQIPQETKLISPTRSETSSPLTLKRMPVSPTRSDSASPLTLKKLTQSPSRSDSSSPLTLKKVTRRYERRSRRGEDSAHKTLEETFAEIAAESSKAVLAAKEHDVNEELPTTKENLPHEIMIIEKDQEFTENLQKTEKPLTVNEEEPVVANEEVVIALDSVSQTMDTVSQTLETTEKVLEIVKPLHTATKSPEKNIETQEHSKVTPARRGRKPKQRSLESTDSKDQLEEKQLSKETMETNQKQSSLKLKESQEESKENPPKKETIDSKPSKEVNEVSQMEAKLEEEMKNDLKTSKTKKAKETIQNEIMAENETNKSSVVVETIAVTSTKVSDEKIENKTTKKPFKKRDSFKTEAVQEESTNLNATKEKEDEVRTPKQTAKKRDTSQAKNETKSGGKKSTKKNKNEEEDSSSITPKDDSLTKTNPNPNTTTPPPSKRGRKPKNQQETPQSATTSKKKNKKEQNTTNENIESESNIQEKANSLESETESSNLDKSFDEKLAKKKRQKKLKEAFEAALNEDFKNAKEAEKTESSTNFGLTRINKSPTPPQTTANSTDESLKITCVTPVEAEEDPDPLKDIEKFIADGVNLLKKDYKLDEDSVDDVLTPAETAKTTELRTEETIKASTEETGTQVFNTFETPADTPINTPSATPPPKSPTCMELATPDENSGVRRSHRIKLITKTPKALVGRGLVRDKERFSIKDDVETKSHYTLDDHLTDLAEVEAKNAKFLKEMEERLSNFQVIKENEYLCERVISREAKKMICDCFLTHEEEERGELGCGEDCLNRLLMIECGPDCNVKERCTNKRFQKLLCSPCRVFRTEKKGFGIMADIEILPGEFIMEYVGEVIDTDEFEKRRIAYSQDKNRHYYFMALRSDAIIDATIKGNISRFINHSCDPNAETQKWTVNGELRIGFFSRKSIMPGEEITFNYQYQRYGREAQRCYCESANCTGWIGQEPTSDEGEQIDDEDDESEDEEEEADTSNLLVQDDDEDSDTSVADPEEVQKQLEMAAAQAEVELAPIQLLEEKNKEQKLEPHEDKSELDVNKVESDEDSKSKFKKLLSKMAEKVAAKQKQTKREQKMQRKKKSKETSADLANKMKFLEDPDIEDEVEFLKECGLKNQSDTLRLSRLMVRAKLVQTRLNLLEILRKGDLPCRRLFLDYHGLRLLHGWMSEDAGNMQIRLALLQTLETLPIANKTVLTDSKVMQVVRNWCGNNTNLSPNDDSSSSNSNSQDVAVTNSSNTEEGTELAELQKLALKLITTWEGLPEIFRIPKKERIEQMKEHEREADRQYAANAETQQNYSNTDRYRRDRFGRGFNTSAPNTSSRFSKPNNGNQHRTANTTPENIKNLSKAQRREMFEAKVARDEAEKRLAEERREFETKCRFFGLDPKKTRPQDIPFCVNPATGQWFSIERKPITTPPSYAHVQVPVKAKSTDPNDYQLPAVCSTLPAQWKYAITPQGKIYYYHIKHRIPQWEPPTPAQLQECEMEDRDEDSESELTTTAGEDSSDDDDEVLIGMDAAQLKAYIDRKVESRRQKRYQRLVDERSISVSLFYRNSKLSFFPFKLNKLFPNLAPS